MRLSIYGSQPIIAPRDPILPMEVATKNYVDTSIANFIGSNVIQLTQAQKNWLDNITATATEVNYLTGVTGNIQTQLNGKVSKSGDTMTGALILYGAPQSNLEAATKKYVDDLGNTKLDKEGGTMSGFLFLHASPENSLHAATKGYVDTQLSGHTNNTNAHLSPTERTWLSGITVTSTEINSLANVGGNVQSQLDSKFNKAGGTITGDVTLDTGKAVFVSKVPSADTELANKAYVDSKILGQEWKDPLTEADLVDISLSAPPASPSHGATYIAASTAGSGWLPFCAYTWDQHETKWCKLQDRAVAIGDRFGVGFTLPNKVAGDLIPHTGKIIVITNVSPTSISYSVTNTKARDTTIIFDRDSPRFGYTVTKTDEGLWAITNASVNLKTGAGIGLNGNTLYANIANGLKYDEDKIAVKVKNDSILQLDGDGLNLTYNSAHLRKNSSNELDLSTALRSDIDDRLSKANGGTVEGNVTFDNGSSLTLEYTATTDNHAVTKKYVDDKATGIGGDLTSLEGRVETLEEDPVTKGYTNTELAKKLNLAGGTMTGQIVLPDTQTNGNQATSKGYVDNLVNPHVTNSTIHLTEGEKALVSAITATSTEINSLVGIDGPVQTQLDSKVDKAGSIMTGALVLYGAPQNNLEAATKKYVDGLGALKLNLTGGTLTGTLTLNSAPANDLEAATKKYVDDKSTSLGGDINTELAKKLDKSGGTMTGDLILNGNPTVANGAANKTYVDNAETAARSYADSLDTAMGIRVGLVESDVSTLKADPVTKTYVNDELAKKLNLTGGTMTGHIVLFADPVEDKHPATKQYVDALVTGLKLRRAVQFTTTAPLVATYVNGSDGVNATLTSTSNQVLTVDGMNPDLGERVLVKNQTNKKENGIYTVNQAGSVSTAWILKRTTDYDERQELQGSYFFVANGSSLKATGWVAQLDNPRTFQVGVDDLNIVQFSASGSYTAGDGIKIEGNTIKVKSVNADRIVVGETGIDLAEVWTGSIESYYNKIINVDEYGRVAEAVKVTSYVDLGLTDVQKLNTRLSSISASTEVGGAEGILVFDGNVAKFRSVAVEGVGLSVTNADGKAGNPKISSNGSSLATPSTLVARDSSGNFSANTVTAALSGNATTATTLQTTRTFKVDSEDMSSITQDFNGSVNVSLDVKLKTQALLTSGEYSLVKVNSKGIITEASKPTSLANLGITDVYTKTQVDALLQDFYDDFNEFRLYVLSKL